jgi:hypothetical protein
MSASKRGFWIAWTTISGIAAIALLFCMPGCQRELPPEEYGTVINEIPELPEAQKSYEMPKLGPPLTEEQKREIEMRH